MNNVSISVKESALAALCLAIALGIRIFFVLSGKMEMTDEFRYYEASVIQAEEQEPVMTSGIAFTYTGSLSDIFKLTGNRIEAVAVYHLALQAAAFFFLFLSCFFFFGRIAAFLTVLLFSFSPWMITGIFLVSPENYYLSFWSFILLLISLFYKKTKENGWYRNNRDEAYLLATGFFLGVICIWHFTGFLLILLMVFAMMKNAASVQGKRKAWKEAYKMESLLEQEDDFEDEKPEVMSVFYQIFILMLGLFLGGYCTLMKYTGVTGEFIKGQFDWWKEQMFYINDGRWQDLAVWFPGWLILLLLPGAGLQMLAVSVFRKRKEQEENMSADMSENISENIAEEEEPDENIPKRKVWKKPYVKDKNEKIRERKKWNEKKKEVNETILKEEEWNESVLEEKGWDENISDEKKWSENITEEEWGKDVVNDGQTIEEWIAGSFGKETDAESEPLKKKVRYIENPLPLPKKHVKRTLDFKLDNKQKETFGVGVKEDEFDIKISEFDDFDL